MRQLIFSNIKQNIKNCYIYFLNMFSNTQFHGVPVNDSCNDDNDDIDGLVATDINKIRDMQHESLDENSKLNSKTSFYEFQKYEVQAAPFSKSLIKKKTIVCLILTIFVLLLAMSLFERNFARHMSSLLGQLRKSVTTFNILEFLNIKCKNDLRIFRVYYNQNDKEMEKLSEVMPHNQKCEYPIYGFYDLEKLSQRWNLRYPDNQVDLGSINEDGHRKQLLVLFILYFQGGVFIDISIPVCNISNIPLKYAVTSFEPIFTDFQHINQEGIYIPDPKKFIKARIPYSPIIRQMILNLIKGQDFLERCRKKQCIIIR